MPYLQVSVDNELLVAVLHSRHYLKGRKRGQPGGGRTGWRSCHPATGFQPTTLISRAQTTLRGC